MCNPLVGMSHDTSSTQRLSRIRLLGRYAQPDLVGLMNLFIGWGMAVLKKQWLDRIGYH